LKRFSFPLLVITIAILACGTPKPSVLQPTGSVDNSVVLPNPDFIISVEYGILGVARTYADAGVTYSKLQNAFAIWGNIEPERGKYEWGPLDALVMEYQQAGFTGLQMDLTALSPWASSILPSLGNQGDAFPKVEYLNDYSSFVTAVVERYDQDGVDDMPGLLYPIHDYGVEREFSGFWPGTAEEYIRLLRIAYPTIKAADPYANVLLVALLMTDIFNGTPIIAEIQQRLGRKVDYMRKSVPEIQAILAACDAYDIVDFHSLGNYTEIPLTTAWIRQELLSLGCGEKPVWIGDAFPMSGLVGYGGLVPPTPFSPVTLESRDAMVKLLQAATDPSDPDHASSLAWLYAETAIGLTRKITVSAGEGLRGINIGNLEDWKTGIPAVDRTAVPMLGGSMLMGLTDTTVTNDKPGGTLPFSGQDWSKARHVGDLRPAWRTLELVIGKIGGFTSVQKLDLGPNIWAYQFETPTGTVWVLWYDNNLLYLPGETSPSVKVNLLIKSASATLTLIPTEMDQERQGIQTLQSTDGTLSFDLGATPVFIQ